MNTFFIHRIKVSVGENGLHRAALSFSVIYMAHVVNINDQFTLERNVSEPRMPKAIKGFGGNKGSLL